MARKDLSGEMLEVVAGMLDFYGRPRKLPGKERPAAVLKDGSTLQKITPRYINQIQHLSLPGTFRYVQITGKYGKIPSEKAKHAFYETHTDKSGFSTGILDQEIDKIDQETSDTRELVRSLRAARKKLRKAANLNAT